VVLGHTLSCEPRVPFIEANGVGLRYELTGSAEHTIVLLHEMGGSLERWDEVAPALARERRVLCCDTRGAGLSPPSARLQAQAHDRCQAPATHKA
jgi:pimeloyl-ACP methyl ester carboxylesterase